MANCVNEWLAQSGQTRDTSQDLNGNVLTILYLIFRTATNIPYLTVHFWIGLRVDLAYSPNNSYRGVAEMALAQQKAAGLQPEGHSRQDLVANLRAFGIKAGDVLYVRAGLRAIGPLQSGKRDTFLEAALEAVGPRGTVVTPSFGRQFLIWQRDIPFADEVPAMSGTMGRLMALHPDALRSAHQTHPFIAIGARARDLTADHGRDGACFEPIRRLIELNGKMMVVGCVAESPGFSTVHLAQYDLGLTQHHRQRHFYHVKLRDEDGKPYFYRAKESPGCSHGFGRFYSDYAASGNFRTGRIGDAWSVLVNAAPAYRVEFDRLDRDPTYAHCDRPTCLRCKVLCGYNRAGAPLAMMRLAAKHGTRHVRKLLRSGKPPTSQSSSTHTAMPEIVRLKP